MKTIFKTVKKIKIVSKNFKRISQTSYDKQNLSQTSYDGTINDSAMSITNILTHAIIMTINL